MKKLLLLTLTCAYGISMYAMELTESDSDLMVLMKEPVPVAIKLPNKTKSSQSESSDKGSSGKSVSATKSSSESETTLSSSSEKISNPIAKSDKDIENEFIDELAAAVMFASPQELKIIIHATAKAVTATKKDKEPRTSALLQQEIDRLSSAIAKTKIAYEETKKKGEEAQKRTRMPDQIFNGGWSKDDLTEFDCKEKCQKLHKQLIELEQQSAHIKYQLFRNHIKHSHPTKLKMAIPNAVGCFDKITYESEYEKISYPKYCLFTQEQKIDLHAYAQTIIPKRFEAVQGARDNEDMFTKPHDPKVREKHEKACQVLLLMKEFKNMSFKRQQSFSNWLTYKSS